MRSVARRSRAISQIVPRRAIAIVLGVIAVAPADAQVVERHLPPAPAPAAVAPALPAAPGVAASEDERPLGPRLRAIVLLGAGDAPSAVPPASAVDASRLGGKAGRDLAAELAPFIGRPLSRRLITDIEARIVRDWRRRGRPFVDVSAPEQELTGGVLNLRVVEFRLGRIAVAGATGARAAHIAAGLRARPGGPIEAARLEQDLDWLNRYPFRTVEVALAPGGEFGESDIDLKATALKPWRVFAGYQTSDSAATGESRIFAGATAALPLIADGFVSWQVTGSPDFWAGHGPFGQPHPQYLSQAARLVAPTGPRQAIELTVDTVETNAPVEAFEVRQSTFEAALDYRFALSNALPLPGDLAVGVEARRQVHDTFFGGVEVAAAAADIFQVRAEWSDAWSDARGRWSLDGTVHVSPGGIDARNADAALSAFTGDAVSGSRYAYATFDISRLTRLPKGFFLTDEIVGQYAGGPLPPTEQAPLGGQAMVRGYLLDGGAFDDALVARQELHAPPIAGVVGGVAATAAPFVFADAGWGREEAAHRSAAAASLGVGLAAQLGAGLRADLLVSLPLVALAPTRAGAARFDGRVSFTF